ncbi:hypothetical protein JB92DRAFT_2828574 [Gautieria morchelliformis]|nr:hypothetical protein JB92DRAFT_2828574 [Gautieria morchelliformis]
MACPHGRCRHQIYEGANEASQHPLNQQTPSNYCSTVLNDALDTDINDNLLNVMAFGDLETFSLDHNFPLSSNLNPDMFSNHPGFPLDDSQPRNYAGVTGNNTKADHIDITVNDSQCPPSAALASNTILRNSLSSTTLRLPSLLLDHRFPLNPSSRPPSLADGKTLSSAPPPMRSRLVAGDVIFKSNLVLEHMFPEVAGITTQ